MMEKLSMDMHMDRAIFHLNAGVPATSLYILICSLLDEGQSPTLERAKKMWSGTSEALSEAIDELVSRKILLPVDPGSNGSPVALDLSSNWRRVV